MDFDDGNCPTYYNQIKGIHNVFKVVHSLFPSKCFTLYEHPYWHSYITAHDQEDLCGCTRVNIPGVETEESHSDVAHHSSCSLHVFTGVPHVSQAPVLMLRPRAWNMVEHNMMVAQHLYFTVVSAHLDPNLHKVVEWK